MDTAYLGLGSNLGDRRAHLRAAVEGLDAADPVRVTAGSAVYEAEAHTMGADEEQPPFLNAVVEVEVACAPERLLRIAQRLERAEGRTREGERWAPRPLDVDLLVVGDRTRQTDILTLPHPRLAERRFVLRPWADLAPNLVVPPPFDATVQELLEACPDTTAIRRTDHTFGRAGA
jgi:2-amino-4-hydroxy-6-hydroxymethyldihydropteridine diphosphokinase